MDGTEVPDIRNYFKYDFILNENNEVMVRLKRKTTSKKWIVLNMMKKNCQIPQDPFIDCKYGVVKNGRYQFIKQPIQLEKAEDIHSMTAYCDLLTEEEKQEWYPKPTNFQIQEESDDDLTIEYEYLRKRINENQFDEEILAEIINTD